MTECIVLCQQCRDKDKRARRWHWLCECCAQKCLDNHRADTGHTDLELRVVQDAADSLRTQMASRQFAFVSRRYGW